MYLFINVKIKIPVHVFILKSVLLSAKSSYDLMIKLIYNEAYWCFSLNRPKKFTLKSYKKAWCVCKDLYIAFYKSQEEASGSPTMKMTIKGKVNPPSQLPARKQNRIVIMYCFSGWEWVSAKTLSCCNELLHLVRLLLITKCIDCIVHDSHRKFKM